MDSLTEESIDFFFPEKMGNQPFYYICIKQHQTRSNRLTGSAGPHEKHITPEPIRKKMKKVLFFLSALFFTSTIYAQQFTEEQLKKIQRENVVPSKIITKEGDTLPGFLKAMHTPTLRDLGYNPEQPAILTIVVPETEWGCKIKFISEADFNSEKIKHSMFKKYTPKDIKGYIYDYTGQNLIFRTKYVKCGNFTYNGDSFVKFNQELPDGEYACEYYFPFKANVSGSPTVEELQPFTRSHYAIYNPQTDKVILIEDQKPEEFYAQRCPQIVENWKNDKYTNVSSKQGSKLNKLAKLAAKVNQENKDEARNKAFEDYLNTCVKK